MFTQDANTNVIMTRPVKKTDVREVTAEYTLPDYLPDITRLLRVSAKATFPEKYPGAGNTEYDGRVIFDVVYATGEGEIRCAVFDSEYSGSFPTPEADDFSCITVSASAENASCRLGSPRKLTLKCKLPVSICISNRKSADPAIAGNGAEAQKHMQYRKKTVRYSYEIKAEETGVPISEDVGTEPSMPQIERIVFADIRPCMCEASCSDGKISYSCSFAADILYESADGEYVSFSRDIPVSGELSESGITSESIAVCEAEASNLAFRPQTNELGETNTVEIDFDCAFYFRVFGNGVCEISSDAYSLAYETSCEKETFKYLTLESSKNFNFSFSENAELDADETERAVCANAQAQINSVERSGNKTYVSGSVTFHAVLGASASFSGKSFSFPFKCETDAGRYPELFTYTANAYTSDTSARISGGKIYFDTEISVSLVIFGEKETEALRSCTVFTDRPAENASSDIILCFPSRADDLWSIAKKYRTTVDKLAYLNGIGKEQNISGALVIPARNMPESFKIR